MSEERARLFVALELPEDVRAELAAWAQHIIRASPAAREAMADSPRAVPADSLRAVPADSLRAVPAESLHVTLCFLGSLPVGTIAAIAAAVDRAAGVIEANLSLGRPVWLPRRRPAVLAVEVNDPSGALARTQAAVSAALVEGQWHEPERRPFFAHVTVGRVRRGMRVRAVELPAPEPLVFTGSAVRLFRSRSAPGGSRYEPLSGP